MTVHFLDGGSLKGSGSSDPEHVLTDAWNSTGTRTIAGHNYKFSINNTGNADLTFTINGLIFTVKSLEKFEDIFDAFTQVVVSATSTFEANASGLKNGSSLPLYSVKDYFAGSANVTRAFSGPVYGIVISNDGASSLSYTVNGITLQVEAGDVIERYFDALTQVDITSTVAFRAYAKSTLGAAVTGNTAGADVTAPSNVTNLVASNVTQNSLTLGWTASASSDIASYDIYNGTTLLANVTGTTYDITALSASTAYTFWVKAKDGTGNVASGTSVAVTTSAQPQDTTAPNNVTNLSAGSIAATTLTLSWTASVSTDIASYDIYNGASLLGNTATTNFNVMGLTEKTQYTFTVKAKDTSNNVASGTSVTVTTADVTAPANVTGLTTASVTDTTLTLNWTASASSDVASYDVYNGATLLGNVTATTYNVTGLTASTAYTFWVKAKDASNNVASGTSAAVTTSAAPDVTPPNPVTGLTAGTPTSSTIPLTWTLSSSIDVANQEVAYSTDGTNFTVASGVVNPSSTSYTVTGLTSSTAYTVRVIAIDGAGNRSTGTTTTATTAAATPPNPVTALTAGTLTPASISVSWTPSTSNYVNTKEVAYSTDGTTFTVAGTIAKNVNSYVFTGLTAATLYTLRVVAIDASNNRSTSTTVQATTQTAGTADTTAPVVKAYPNGATFASNQTISVTLMPDETATIYYTTDNSTPTTSSAVYSAPISVTATTTLKFFGKDTALNSSAVQTAVYTKQTFATPNTTTVTSGLLHSYDLSQNQYNPTVLDNTGAMPLTLTSYKTDGTEGWLSDGLKSSNTGYSLNSTASTNLGMTTPGSSFTVVLMTSLNIGQYGTSFLSSSNTNNAISNWQAGPETNAIIVGRFQFKTNNVGALHVHPCVLYQESTSTQVSIIRDDAATAASSISNAATNVWQLTYDQPSKTLSLYLNGTLNKSYVTIVDAKFDGIVLNSGYHTDYALLIYNRVLTGAELTQVSNDLLT